MIAWYLLLSLYLNIRVKFQVSNVHLDVQCDEFVQVLHNGAGHWLTVSNIGATNCKGKPEIFVYDSMYQSVGSFAKTQIAAMLASEQAQIDVKMMNVQRQEGGSDCGLFAIAFAPALVNGIQPAQLNFHQDAMRKHLYNCLEKGELTMFPLGKKTRRVKPIKSIKSVDFIELYCTCRMPQLPGEMVECSDCKDWYHVDCVSVPQEALDNTATPWFCSLCQHH